MRPTKLDFVPRVWEMLFQEVQGETDSRAALDGPDRGPIERRSWPSSARDSLVDASSRR